MLAHTPRTLVMNSLLDRVGRSIRFFVSPCSEDGPSRLSTTLGNERIAQAVLGLVHLRPLVGRPGQLHAWEPSLGTEREADGTLSRPGLLVAFCLAAARPVSVAEHIRTGGRLKVAGLFAGIGGIERGLHGAGHTTDLLCEIDPAAQAILAAHFPGIPLADDVRTLSDLPEVDLVAGGFPCQDLSQAGTKAGISGGNSGLVTELFRLVQDRKPPWLLLENVSFMLQLDRGTAMRFLADSLGEMGYSWAYRVVDTRAFGLPQRRRRVVMLASLDDDPREVLFADNEPAPDDDRPNGWACGFYWTEGTRGLGWAVDAVPTLKGGSTIGIPSPPAVLLPDGRLVTPDIRDAERLQGFPADWTKPAEQLVSRSLGKRWKLVGNAVSVPVFGWVGERLASPGAPVAAQGDELARSDRWPEAAWGWNGKAFAVDASAWPRMSPRQHLHTFLEYEPTPLSSRAAVGFLRRARASTLRFPEGLLDAVDAHVARLERAS